MAANILLTALLFACASSESTVANPIRKVVNMLQAMQKQVEAEGVKEKEMFDKFMCYCKTSGGDLKSGISAAETKIPNVGSNIEEGKSKQTQLKADLKQYQSDRAAAKQSIADATALRKKTAGEFAHTHSDLNTNIAALGKAIAALEAGMTGSFLQSSAARFLKNILAVRNMPESDRQEVTAFLSGRVGYSPQSGEITGILKEMKDEMERDNAAAVEEENASIASFKELVAAKTKEVNALTAGIEKKSVRSGELAVEIVQMTKDLSDTEAALLEDKQFLADMDKNCATKSSEWDVICKTRSDELVALAETIKVLNDDDALELFKKTLPGASAVFVQLTASMGTLRQRALKLVQANQKESQLKDLNFISLALRGKKIGFEKVIGMIDEMVVLLKEEQGDDNNKKEYCAKQFDSLDDSKKGLERSVSDAASAIETSTDAIATLASEIKALRDSIAALDKSVAEATAQRKEENADYKALQAADSAAKEVLGFAKNRLNKFYNPKLYVAPPKRQLDREDAIVHSMGGELEATPAPGGIAGTGIAEFVQISRHEVAPPPPPESAGAYQTKAQGSNGVIAMIDLLIKDLDLELTESTTTEKDSQSDYEATMADAAKKRSMDSKSLTNKIAAKAEAAANLQGHQENHASKSTELMNTEKVISELHGECDWLLQNFDARNAARNGEIDALTKAKAVLSGADYALVQVKRSLRGH